MSNIEDIEEEKSVGQIIDEVLKSPEMILKQVNRIVIETKEEMDKVVKENEELKEMILEKEKHIKYLEGKIEGLLLIKNMEV